MDSKVKLCGLWVSPRVRDQAIQTWPKRPPTGYDDRTWGAACAQHVLLVMRELGEQPGNGEQAESPEA